MSDISHAVGRKGGLMDESDSVAKRWWNRKDFIFLLPFFLLFIGDFQLPVGASVVIIPMGMVFIAPVVFWHLIAGRLTFSAPSLLLTGVLFCGFLGFLLTPLASLSRSAAGALPIIFAALTIVAYEFYSVPQEKAVRCMLVGGVVLAIAVIFLFVLSLGELGGYYDRKLIIETPLGRSNYLAAFLIFLLALNISGNIFISIIFLIAIFCTLSRGGVLALMVFFVLIPLLRRIKVWVLGVGLLLALLIFYCLVFNGFVSYIAGIFDLKEMPLDSVFNRFKLWSFGFDIFSANPVFGVGPNTFRTFVELAGNIENVWGVHNSILLLIINYGFFGLLFYLAYLVLIYRNIILAEKVDGKFFYLRVVFLALLIFGFYEPLVGSAAFEVLLALILVLARSQVRMISP